MVTVDLPSLSSLPIQQYYVQWFESTTGACLMLGPFYMDRNGNPVSLDPVELNYGAPYCPNDIESISGQNPVVHENAKGHLSLSRPIPYSADAYFKKQSAGDPNISGDSIAMSDFKDWSNSGRSLQGYLPGSANRGQPPNIYNFYVPYVGAISFNRYYGNDYYGEGKYAGIGSVVTGHSSSGNIPRGTYSRYDRTTVLTNKFTRVSWCEWTVSATLTERKRTYSSGSCTLDSTSTYSNQLAILFTSPPYACTQMLRRDVIYDISWKISSALARLIEPENMFGTLVKESVQSIRYTSSNNLENASDMRDPKSIAPPIRSIKNLISKKNPKALADIYLWYKYALLPTCSDVPELINAAGKQKKRYTGNYARSAARTRTYTNMGLTQTCVSTAGTKFFVDPAFHAKMVLQSWGVDPSFSNAWDLVPFSFVVDWFCNVGDTLSNFDYEFDVFTNTYHFDYINCSNKVIAEVPNLNEYFGGVTVSLYRRIPLRSVPFSYDRQPSTASSHILEMAALVVSK